MKNFPVARLFLWSCVIAFALCVMCSCSMKFDPNGTEPTEDAALVTKVQQDVETLKQTFQQQAEAAKAAGDEKAAATFTKAADVIGKGQAQIKVAPDGTLDIAAMASLIPVYGPYIGLALAGFKWWQSSNAGKSVVRHLDNMISSDPAVKAAFKQMPENVKANARALLTPTAAKLIDNVSVT